LKKKKTTTDFNRGESVKIMPELLMERPKMSLQMHETLKKYILRERRKKKEEDEISEQKIREEMVNL